METFQNAIRVKGLGDDIYTAMLQNAQEKIVDQIRHSAKGGSTNCVVKTKGITPSFLEQLEEEGVSNYQKDDDHVVFFWEW